MLRLSFLRLFLMLLLCAASPGIAFSETRSALVIGNSAYGFGPLLNPENDARLLSQTLEKTGFTVKTVLNADRQTMQKALLDFSRDIRDKDTVGLFYFAGHGAQVAGQNYLIPVDADIKAESEVKIFGINVDEFVATLERADGRTNIVILDSCRNNPFGAAARSARKGLAAIDAPAGTFIAYSTAPGQVALDGEGDNSPYAQALAKAIVQPNVSIEQAFKLTRREVLEATGKVQVPWESSSLTGDFIFQPVAAAEELAPPAPAAEATVDEPVADAADTPQPAAPAPVAEPAQLAVSEATPPAPPAFRDIDPAMQTFPVGKWPEGLAVADNAIWVAESGSRRIVKIDPGAGDLLEAVPVGRLPVGMAADPDGNVYAATFTDQSIFVQPPGGAKGKTLTRFKKTFLRGISFGNGAIYAATSTEDNERVTLISRIEADSGKTTSSAPFLADTRSFVMAQDAPWILDTSNTVTMFDSATLQPVASIGSDGFMWSLAANLDAVFVGGRVQQMEGKSIVQRHAQGNPQDKLVQVLDSDELIVALTANNDRVAALGTEGTVWILDAASLAPLKRFNTGRRPQAAVFENGNLFITSHMGDGENGVLMVYPDVGNID